MKNNNEPKLYPLKTKIIIAVCSALVLAAVVVGIVLIAKSNKETDGKETGSADTGTVTEDVTPDTEDQSGYRPVDTGVVTDEPIDTDKGETGTGTPDTETAPDTDVDKPDDTAQPADTGIDTDTPDTANVPADKGVEIGEGIFLTAIEPYSGPFVEDGSDEQVDNIISIVVKNTGDNAIQLLNITVATENGDAEFSATTILPNTSVVVLEKNRMAYPGADKLGAAKISQIGMFLEEPSFYSDKFEVKGTDGTISITNKGSEDVSGKVVVYYKSVKDGKYFGGITYSATLNGGVPANTTILINANHFRINDSRLMFVKYE